MNEVVVPVKKPWESKTNWMSLVVAVVAFVPSVGEWIASNVEMFGMIVGGIFALLRMVTKGKISIE